MIQGVTSKDGTPIAYQRSGEGPPLILVHGTLGVSRRWPVVPLLAERFAVYAMDRRGRGDSGDGPDYSLAREAEDIVALASAIGGAVSVLGHSFGALCALEAALLLPNLSHLILYEPALSGAPSDAIARLEALLDAGEREAVVLALFREIVEMPPDEVELLRASPNFPAMVAAAHTVPRESRAEEQYRFVPARFGRLAVPTLLLLGEHSPPSLQEPTATLHAALPNSRIAVLPGQQHIAHYTAPVLFAAEVARFLSDK